MKGISENMQQRAIRAAIHANYTTLADELRAAPDVPEPEIGELPRIPLSVEGLRPEVFAFAHYMEWKLRLNEGKGGWKNDSMEALVNRINQEAVEVLKARSDHLARFECADVANFAMMIWDNCGGMEHPLGLPPRPIEPIKGKMDEAGLVEVLTKTEADYWAEGSIHELSHPQFLARSLLTAYGPPASGGVDLSKLPIFVHQTWGMAEVKGAHIGIDYVRLDDLRALLQDTAKESGA